MKIYGCIDSCPSLGVRMCLTALKIPFEFVNLLYEKGEHMTEEYAKMNPQKELPTLEDNGFYLSESIAIMQYLCDQYAPDSPLYPKEPKQRAIVNQRLCFNNMFYYSNINMYALMPIYFDYERSPLNLKKLKISLETFETHLKRSGTKYAAAEHLTIADFSLVAATLCLESIDYSLDEYPLIKKWYEAFKKEYPEIWNVAKPTLDLYIRNEKYPPDLSELQHPFYPARKLNI